MVLEVKAEIQVGTLTALFGPSGAGKTMLLRILAGLTKPDAGCIRFANEVWYNSEHNIDIPPRKRRIGLMFQDYALFPNMTVEQNIRFAQDEQDHGYTKSLLEVFDIAELAQYKPTNLSGGQKQRVALARAIARKPRLLLLDEPLSALDAGMRVMLQDEIAKAHRMFASTTIMVSHDLNEVFRLANAVICVERGKVTARGAPQQVFANADLGEAFQVAGQVASIERDGAGSVVTVITENKSTVKVVDADEAIRQLSPGDRVLVYSKAFNPVIRKM